MGNLEEITTVLDLLGYFGLLRTSLYHYMNGIG